MGETSPLDRSASGRAGLAEARVARRVGGAVSQLCLVMCVGLGRVDMSRGMVADGGGEGEE